MPIGHLNLSFWKMSLHFLHSVLRLLKKGRFYCLGMDFEWYTLAITLSFLCVFHIHKDYSTCINEKIMTVLIIGWCRRCLWTWHLSSVGWVLLCCPAACSAPGRQLRDVSQSYTWKTQMGLGPWLLLGPALATIAIWEGPFLPLSLSFQISK